ncbi:RNA 2',3'-cyclic phosphodiesterase [Candidatus Bathyarchaeota archaeon ex4484_135]|nr:MAG: RNA 2',3'-cyclic phosphodiesterase [Candidatus Bathyarchaeota archaeon ex4484_135]
MPELSFRAFIAIDVEEPSVLDRISELQAILAGTKASLKLVERENIHITLWFLGNITPRTAEQINKCLEAVKTGPFVVELTGVGAFPSPGRPRVIWVGVGRGSDELKAIYEELKPCLRRLGFRPDPKGFTPHVTVARVKFKTPELVKAIMENSAMNFGSFRAEEIRLKKSVLTPRGPVYSTVSSVRLGET